MEFSPVELTRAFLERIDAVDGQLHSYITVLEEGAMAAARSAEADILRGDYRGPLHGIPIALKDCTTPRELGRPPAQRWISTVCPQRTPPL